MEKEKFQYLESKEDTMPLTRRNRASREIERKLNNQGELIWRITQAIQQDGVIQVLEGVFLARASSLLGLNHHLMTPSFCMIVQGSKEFLLGDSRYYYDPNHYLITALELPSISQILEATPARPYISLRINLDSSLVESVIEEVGLSSQLNNTDIRAMDVGILDVNLQDAVLRLVRLIDNPAEAPFLAKLIKKEIVYRLLMGQQGARLRYLAAQGTCTPHIAKVVDRIRQNFDQPMNFEDLAYELGMSVSGLYHSFKAVTALSPLQFQKQLRLQEARRLMLSEGWDAASAAYRVGYHDPAYFNRVYKSVFGLSPIRHIKQLREGVSSEAV